MGAWILFFCYSNFFCSFKEKLEKLSTSERALLESQEAEEEAETKKTEDASAETSAATTDAGKEPEDDSSKRKPRSRK